jgi:hypothetical protein
VRNGWILILIMVEPALQCELLIELIRTSLRNMVNLLPDFAGVLMLPGSD